MPSRKFEILFHNKMILISLNVLAIGLYLSTLSLSLSDNLDCNSSSLDVTTADDLCSALRCSAPKNATTLTINVVETIDITDVFCGDIESSMSSILLTCSSNDKVPYHMYCSTSDCKFAFQFQASTALVTFTMDGCRVKGGVFTKCHKSARDVPQQLLQKTNCEPSCLAVLEFHRSCWWHCVNLRWGMFDA
eukprot:PhF_6_TR30371/c0_g2_i1/m.44489